MRSLRICGLWLGVIVVIIAIISYVLLVFVPVINEVIEVVPLLQERKEFLETLARVVGK